MLEFIASIHLLFLGLILMMTIPHMPRVRKIGFSFSLRKGINFNVSFYKKKSRV